MNQLIYHYSKYHNSFHNFDHAFAVMQGALKLAKYERLDGVSVLDKFCFVLAALCHDVGHTGRSNTFETGSNSKLAIRYFDRSVLESHHLGLSFKILSKPESNVLAKLPHHQFKRFRKVMAECILSTDSRFHSLKMNEFKLFLRENNSTELFTYKDMLKDDQNLLVLFGTSLHAADFYGNVQPFDVSRFWAEQLHKEFRAQYALEIELELEPTPFYAFLDDPVKTAESETIFVENVVLPLWKVLGEWYTDYLDTEIENIKKNIMAWRKMA